MEQQQTQRKVLTPEDQQARIKFFMKKKGLSHLQEKVVDNLAKLELQMEKDGVTEQDIRAGRATEKVFQLLDKLNASKIATEGVLGFAYNKAIESKEFDTFEEEFSKHRDKVEVKRASQEEIEKAKEKYFDNPTIENMSKYVGKGIDIKDDETDPSERRAFQQAEARKQELNEILGKINDEAIEKVAREEAHKMVAFKRLNEVSDQRRAELEAVNNDPRIKVQQTRVEHKDDEIITARAKVLAKEIYQEEV